MDFWTYYKSLNIGFIKFDYFINQNDEIIKEFKDVFKILIWIDLYKRFINGHL